MTGDRPFSALRWRIFLAFGIVAVLSVGLVAAVTAISTRTEVEALVGRDHARTTRAVAEQVAAAYRSAGGWEGADLAAAQAVAAAAGAQLAVVETTAVQTRPRILPRVVVRATAGVSAGPGGSAARQLTPAVAPSPGQRSPSAASTKPRLQASSAPSQRAAPTAGPASGGAPAPRAPARSAPAASSPPAVLLPSAGATPHSAGEVPVTVDGSTVGAVVVTYPSTNAADAAALQARDVILDRVALTAGLALLVAVVVAAFVARRIARPVAALTAAADAVERGERHPVLPSRAPGELGRLARTFGRMAAGLNSAEQARRAMVADVAHELRTPVTILRGNLEGMVDGVTAATPDLLQSLHDEVLKLARVLDDLAALASADEGSFQLEPAPLDLADVAGRVVDVLTPAAAAAGVDLAATLVPTPVVGDETRLHQVLMNLVGNAVKFSSAGGAVRVSVRCAGADGEITVTDEGPGIPPDELPHVFERFWRGDRARGTSGSGVGLAVVRQLVEAHGGSVQAFSAPGEGARFVVRVPAADTAHATAPSRGE